jgi:hypothetical protein
MYKLVIKISKTKISLNSLLNERALLFLISLYSILGYRNTIYGDDIP